MNNAPVILWVAFAVTSCGTRQESLLTPPPAATASSAWSSDADRSGWEQRIPVGVTEAEFQRLIREDAWASKWLHPSRTMDTPEIVDWAQSRAVFIGRIHEDLTFQAAVAANGPFHLYSSQGIPTTASQMTVICAKDLSGVWRVRNPGQIGQ